MMRTRRDFYGSSARGGGGSGRGGGAANIGIFISAILLLNCIEYSLFQSSGSMKHVIHVDRVSILMVKCSDCRNMKMSHLSTFH